MSKNNQMNKTRSKIPSKLNVYIKKAGLFFCSNKTSSFEVYIFIVYTILLLIQIPFHEQWQDELQAWLIARDCSIPRIFYMMRFEGHFALWQLILHPFAKLGLPVLTLNIISTILCSAASWLLLFHSPFIRIVKIALLLCAPLMYWYPIISRCYALVPLLLFLLAITYNKRRQKLLLLSTILALLANTHVFMEGLVGAVFVLLCWELLYKEWNQISKQEKTRRIIALFIVIAGVLIAFLQVVPAFSMTREAQVRFHSLTEYIERYIMINKCFFTYCLFIHNPIICVIFWFTFLFFLLLIFRKSLSIFFVTVTSIFWIFLFATCLYSLASPQQCYLILFIMIFSSWIVANIPKEENKNHLIHFILFSPTTFLCIFVILSYRMTALYVPFDLKHLYTTNYVTARFIQNNIPIHEKIYIFPTVLATSVISTWLPQHVLYSGENQNHYTYLISSKNLKRDFVPQHLLKCFDHANNNHYYAIVQRKYVPDFISASNQLHLSISHIYSSPTISFPSLTGESYDIFLVERL